MSQSPPQLRTTKRLRREHYRAAVMAAAEAFPPGNRHGVFGIAVQRKRVRGRECSYSSLSLFVERKQEDPRLAVGPVVFRHGRASFSVLPDVVATGHVAVAARGSRPAFTGLHPGAAIRVDGAHRCAGGVTCLLNLDGRPTHLLTAGHLFPPSAGRFAVTAASGPGTTEVEVGRLALNLLDEDRGSSPIDVALVALNAQGIRMAIESASRSRIPALRPTPFDSVFVDLARLKVFLPTTGDYAPIRGARNTPSVFRLETRCRPPHLVADVITTDFANNTRGNSGTILMTDEGRAGDQAPSSAVGVAIGFAAAFSLYEPLDRAMRAIRSRTGDAFRIWASGP